MKIQIILTNLFIYLLATLNVVAESKLITHKNSSSSNVDSNKKSEANHFLTPTNSDSIQISITELNALNRVELAQQFPEGNTEQNFVTSNCQIKRIVVVRGSHGDDYRMINCKWGQTFYKKNGIDISEILFNHDTSNKD